jgi:general secretion pathway protein H
MCVVRGFTLLELLVVLVVAGIMLTLAAVNLFPDERQALREQGEQLALLLEQAASAARAGGVPLAWSCSRREHRFWRRNAEGEWQRVEGDPLLRPRTLSAPQQLRLLTLDGRPAQAGDLLPLSPETVAVRFELRLSDGRNAVELAGNGLGQVEVVAP